MLETEVKTLLREHRFTPKRSLGQNFLMDPAGLNLIIEGAKLAQADLVLEIGAGLGTLTRILAESCAQVVAVEVDQRLKPILEQELQVQDNVILRFEDFLQTDLTKLPLTDQFKVVANIPYYITSAIMRKLMTAPIRPSLVVLTLQREVAVRIVQQPGQLSLLAISVQLFGDPALIGRIPAKSFYPSPKVDSEVLKVTMHEQGSLDPKLIEGIFQLAQAGFSQKRKMLRNSLAAGLKITSGNAEALLLKAGLDPSSRAQELSIEAWKQLAAIWNIQAGMDRKGEGSTLG